MKSCTKCKEIQSLDNFNNRKTRKGTPIKSSWCKSCMKVCKRKSDNTRANTLRKFVFDYLSNSNCVVCGTDNILVLEFDHKDSKTKSFNIGRAITGKDFPTPPLEKVIEEINKCDVMCRNCHQIKTHRENNSWRYRTWHEQRAWQELFENA